MRKCIKIDIVIIKRKINFTEVNDYERQKKLVAGTETGKCEHGT